jgi:hypothetical protein
MRARLVYVHTYNFYVVKIIAEVDMSAIESRNAHSMNDFIIKNNKFKPFEIFNSNTWPNSSGIFCLLNNQECIFLGRTVKNDNSYIKFIIKPGPSQSTFQGVHDYITIHKNKLSFY